LFINRAEESGSLDPLTLGQAARSSPSSCGSPSKEYLQDAQKCILCARNALVCVTPLGVSVSICVCTPLAVCIASGRCILILEYIFGSGLQLNSACSSAFNAHAYRAFHYRLHMCICVCFACCIFFFRQVRVVCMLSPILSFVNTANICVP